MDHLMRVETPSFVVDERLLARNLKTLQRVIDATGCRILLALKGFACWSTFPLIARTLHGCCASSVHEARLAREEFGGEVHAFAAAFSDADMTEIIPLCDHLVFNSFAQWRRHRPAVRASGREIACGIRVNPEHSEGAVPIYDPCAPGSRLGVRREEFEPDELDGISGLHFHTLCEHNAAPLARTLAAVEKRFGEFLPAMDWLNFGGGHHITRADYDLDLLIGEVNRIKNAYDVQVYLEPGEAVALDAGFLVATVLDVKPIAGGEAAVLDVSAACHMPDVLEMPYRPPVAASGLPGEKPHTYRLAGPSCLAGDVIGDYSFDYPLAPGDRVIFEDMAIYSMVKTTTFTGLALPAIARITVDGELVMQKRFGYQDFKSRLS